MTTNFLSYGLHRGVFVGVLVSSTNNSHFSMYYPTKHKNNMKKFTQPYLIQRLQKALGKANPFSFGGGYKNGGLSDEFMSFLVGIFSFDYMGAAEFEFGALPEAFQEMAKSMEEKKLIAYTHHGVHIISREDMKADIQDWIDLAKETPGFYTKEFVGLHEAIKGERDFIGWVDLDNAYIFFINEAAFVKMADLFGLKSIMDTVPTGKEGDE